MFQLPDDELGPIFRDWIHNRISPGVGGGFVRLGSLGGDEGQLGTLGFLRSRLRVGGRWDGLGRCRGVAVQLLLARLPLDGRLGDFNVLVEQCRSEIPRYRGLSKPGT